MGLLLSQRLRPMPRLMLLSFTEHTDTQLMVTTERDLLKLSQRLMPTMDTTDMPDLMPMELTHMPMVLTTERDLLMLSQRLTPTTDTLDMPDLMPMDMPHMLMVLMEVTGDKLNATQLRSSKANIKY